MKLPTLALAVVTAGAMMGQAPAPQQPNSAQSPAGSIEWEAIKGECCNG